MFKLALQWSLPLFKAKDSEINAIPLCIGNVSKDFSVKNMKNTNFFWYIFDFSVDYDAIEYIRHPQVLYDVNNVNNASIS